MSNYYQEQTKTIPILIIEDDPLQGTYLEMIFKSCKDCHYSTQIATRLDEGLDLLSNKTFDLLILDLNLPDSSGLETLEKVRAHDQDLTIILNSAIDDETIAIKALQIGAQDYLIKGQPSSSSILRAVRYALERKAIVEKLKLSQLQVMQQEKMASIGQLAAGVAHEINNPMGFISSNLTSLQNYLNKIKDFIEYQSTIITSLNNPEAFNKVSDKRKYLKVDFVLEDIADLIDESCEAVGRNGLSVESVFRCLLLKQMLSVSYEMLAFHLSDSLSYRTFARIDPDMAPGKSALQGNIRRIRPETLEAVFEELIFGKFDAGEINMDMLRIDSTER